MDNFWRIGALSATLSVALGAFGAHALKGQLDASAMQTFDTATRYQIYHALGLLLVALRLGSDLPQSRLLIRAGWCFVAGSVLFCGALYTLALGGPGWLGAVAPLGGVLFLAGWISVAFSRTGAPSHAQ